MIKALLLILSTMMINQVYAQADNSFSYQGELIDNGAPANDDYDFAIVMLDGFGAQVGNTSTHLNVPVENGLFNLNVLISGINAFDGFENYFFEVSVRKSSVGGNFTVLSPLQTLQSVPLATNLVNGSATNGQVLTFNGFQWAPADPQSSAVSSPWSTTADGINYTGGKVTIGNVTNASIDIDPLHIKGTASRVATFDGPNRTFVTFAEEGKRIGYIGSFIDDAISTDDDFDIGTFGSNPDGSIQLVTQGEARFTVRSNGDLKQPNIASNGMMKYMIRAQCSPTSSSIINSYNGVDDQAITITNGSSGDVQCTINFPHNINNRFWQVSVMNSSKDRSAHCTFGAADNQLDCYRFNTATDANIAGNIMVLVY